MSGLRWVESARRCAVLAVVSLAGMILAPALASACSCAPPPPPREALKGSTAVFSGKVVEVKRHDEFRFAVVFAAEESWKGIDAREVVVYTPDNGAACGVNFEKGRRYLVYANEVPQGEPAKKVLSTHLCTRTKKLDDAKEDLKDLGEGNKIADKDEKGKNEKK